MKMGVMGAGQLAKMLVLAGVPLGIETVCYSPHKGTCAAQICATTIGDYTDFSTIDAFLAGLDILAFETENIPTALLSHLQKIPDLAEQVAQVKIFQDRQLEKEHAVAQGVPTPNFRIVETEEEGLAAMHALGLPLYAKTCQGGYDGKGQWKIFAAEQLRAFWPEMQGRRLIFEQSCDFECELSLVGVRRKNGETVYYPLSVNQHDEGILSYSLVLTESEALQNEAQAIADRLFQHTAYQGIFAIEFFLTAGRLLLNEVAPRVHNSGHWSLDGAVCSQFENHCRALAGLPLGQVTARGVSLMINIIGEEPSGLDDALAIADTHLYRYGKAARPGRKIGHLTIVAASAENLLQKLDQLCVLVPAWSGVLKKVSDRLIALPTLDARQATKLRGKRLSEV